LIPVEPGRLVGTLFALPTMLRPSRTPSLHQPKLVLDVLGHNEAIVGTAAGGRSLHVYRLEPGDWLVSEVGRCTEGRGTSLSQALAALSALAAGPDWWELIVELLASEDELGTRDEPSR
jgi:hypothetical protein